MVKLRLVSNFDNILRSKIYFFLKKSIWKYLVATLVLGFLKPINELNPILSGLIYFAGINLILWPLQYISTKTYAKTINFDAMVEFSETEIKINHTSQDLIEIKDWNWIKKIELNKKRVWLTLNQAKPFVVSIPRSKLNNSSIQLFERMKKHKE